MDQIRTKELIPQVYTESYDISIFTGLMDLIYNARQVDIETLRSLHCPSKVPDNKLTRLSSLLNLNTTNRDVVQNYKLLIRDKGSKASLLSLARLCGEDDPAIEMKTGTPPYYWNLLITTQTFDYDLFYRILNRVFPTNLPIATMRFDTTKDRDTYLKSNLENNGQ